MWIAELDTEHFQFRGAGTTQKQARDAVAAGFLRHLAAMDGGEQVALERFDLYLGDVDTPTTADTFTDAVDDYYSIHAWRLKAGEALRDGAPV